MLSQASEYDVLSLYTQCHVRVVVAAEVTVASVDQVGRAAVFAPGQLRVHR